MKHLLFIASLFLFSSLQASEDHPKFYASVTNAVDKNFSKEVRDISTFHEVEGRIPNAAFRRNTVLTAKYLSYGLVESFSARGFVSTAKKFGLNPSSADFHFTPIAHKLIFPEHYFW